MRGWIVISGLAGAASVGLAAYGAHALAGDSYAQGLAERAADYLGLHALALLVLVALRQQGMVGRLGGVSSLFFLLGMVLFCGSLSWRAVTGGGVPVPMVTPLGGMCFIIGWLMVAVAAIYRKSCGVGHGSV